MKSETRAKGGLFVRAALLALLLPACAGTPNATADQTNRLAGRTPAGSGAAEHVERIADGALAPAGDFWNTALTAILPTPESAITIDLGEELPIAAAFIQADNNDHYLLSGSSDGTAWKPLWDAAPVRGAGLRVRKGDDIKGRARYLRLTASGGDGAFSVSELQVYSVVPGSWPEPPGGRGGDDKSPHTQWIILFAVACGVFLVFGCHGDARRAAAVALLPAAATIQMLADLAGGKPPFGDGDVALLRSAVGAVALLAVVRPFVMRRPSWTVDGRRITALLGALAALSMACFFNLGRAQFWDAKLRKPSYIHNYDMRVYFPVAKYFNELKYDGVYLASVAAYLENTPGSSIESVANVELRDLRTHEMRRVRDVADQIRTVNQRFTPARWDEFKRDMSYFHETMGRDYFITLTDHGGNATPVWLMVGHIMFAPFHASNALLFVTGLLDPLLVLLVAFFAWRTFGPRTAFLCLIVFGATDIYMFGTDWAGSTLRNDWMAALGLGACALKVRRWYLGGALLAYAGLIRAFPGIAVIGLLVPPIWWYFDVKRDEGKAPSLRDLLEEHQGTLRALIGAAVAVVAMVVLSSLVLSPSAWVGWAKKVFVLTSGYHVNHVSFQSVVSTDYETWEMADGWQHNFVRVALYVIGIVGFAALILRAMRDRPPYQAALIAMFVIPIGPFNAANYYFHYVFLLPMLAEADGDTRIDARRWGPLLGMCVAEYAATVAPTLGQHFVTESICLMAAFLVMLVWLNRDVVAFDDAAESDGDEPEAPTERAPA